MKLVKAYVRTFMVQGVVEALRDVGMPRLTAIDVRRLGDEIDPQELKLSAELGSTYTTMVKLELICEDDYVEKAVNIIKEKAKTGHKGDGLIAVSVLEKVIKIRNGEQIRDKK
jgi:nitrogen regulatory protein P-II 1